MRWNLGIINRNKFILTVGDEGAILTYFRGKKLEQRLFSTVDYTEGKQAFIKLLASDPSAPIHFLLDVMDQSCSQQSLPAVSGLTINKLVKKRLDRDFSPEDVKGALPMGREKTGRKDWVFMFVSSHLSPPFSTWVDFCLEQQNPISGIYMVPVEAEMFQHNLNKALGIDKNKEKTAWQFLVFHNRVSGFRQAVFHEGRLVFSRLIRSAPNELPGVIAGNIEQEVLNSMEYLRRLPMPENTKMDIFICVSEDIKRSFQIKNIKGHPLMVMTPYDIATKLHLTKAVQSKDQFGDVILAADFITRRPVLKLHSMITQHLAALNLLRVAAKYTALAIIPLMLMLSTIRFWEIWDIQHQIVQAETTKQTLNQQWVTLQAHAVKHDDESGIISDMVKLYKLLSGGSFSPLATLAAFDSVKGNNVVVRNIDWKLLESQAKGVASTHSSISLSLSIDFYNEDQSLDRFFANFDRFLKRLETKFSDYSVEYSQLPEKVTVGEVSKVIPIEIRILGPRQ